MYCITCNFSISTIDIHVTVNKNCTSLELLFKNTVLHIIKTEPLTEIKHVVGQIIFRSDYLQLIKRVVLEIRTTVQ